MNAIPYLPDRLTSEQRQAILHIGSPLLIIAGPGSGRTEVLTWRVAYLVRAGLVPPEHLLVTLRKPKQYPEQAQASHWLACGLA